MVPRIIYLLEHVYFLRVLSLKGVFPVLLRLNRNQSNTVNLSICLFNRIKIYIHYFHSKGGSLNPVRGTHSHSIGVLFIC